MYTAIVLICINGIKEPDNCFTYNHEVLHESKYLCEAAIFEALTNKYFTYSDPETGSEEPVDWYCVNWNTTRISY